MGQPMAPPRRGVTVAAPLLSLGAGLALLQSRRGAGGSGDHEEDGDDGLEKLGWLALESLCKDF